MFNCIIKILSFLVLLFSFKISSAENHHHKDSSSFRTTKVTDNITMLQGKGGNIAVLSGEQGLLMIDDDYKQMSEALKKALTPFGGQDKLTYIINTHWHGDHTQGNLALGHSARIIAHDNVRTRLMTSQEVKLFKMVTEPYPEHALPSLTYQKAMTLHINDEEVNIVHYPGGHTDGDSIIFFKKANVVHMGDHYFNGFFPFVDVGTGGNVLKMAENVKMVHDAIDGKTKIIPGHGPVSNKKELRAFYEMLVGTANEVKKMQSQGLTLAQMQEKGLSSRWDTWTKGFLSTKVWIGIVESSLK